jgi:aerobic carbon-monoxide dehydrogenase small subunit
VSHKEEFTLKINGETKVFLAHPMERLLDTIRSDENLTGTKEGCGEGECGACSVLVNGKLVNSCLIPISQVASSEIETIEGVANSESLAPIQKSFLENGGAQCGFCTPGMVLAAISLLRDNPAPNLEEVKTALSGNLCRCTGYKKIFESTLICSQMEDQQ